MSVQTPKKISWEMQFLGGLNLRSLAILGLTMPVAGTIIFTTIIPGPIGIRIALGLIVAGLGLMMVFAKIGGRTFEQWLKDLITWQWSSRTYFWRRGDQSPGGEVDFLTQTIQPRAPDVTSAHPALALTEDMIVHRHAPVVAH